MTSLGKRKQDVSDDCDSIKKPKPDEQQEELSLLNLLDFRSPTTTDDILARFDALSRTLLHDFHLVVRCGNVDTLFEILELELYLQKAGCHEDPFTHGSEEQKFSGRWYFHRAPRRSLDSHRSRTSRTGYRGGTRKGLDLTLGAPSPTAPPPALNASPYFPAGSSSVIQSEGSSSNAPEDTLLLRGGALLRAIRCVSDSTVISGPSLLVDHLLSLSKTASIAELVSKKWRGNTSAFLPVGSEEGKNNSPGTRLFLQPRTATPSQSTKPKPEVYRSPRIGLELSHPGTTTMPDHPRVVFLPRPYRYFVHPHLLTANGRSQTFLGVLRACLDAGMTMGSTKLEKELVRITGLKEPTVKRYLGDYRGGLDQGSLKAFVGPAGKGASSSPTTYLRMMGILERLKNTGA